MSSILLRLHHLGIIDLIIARRVKFNQPPSPPWTYVEICGSKPCGFFFFFKICQPPILNHLVNINYQVWSMGPSMSHLVRKNDQVREEDTIGTDTLITQEIPRV